jgi:hypothetical protein
MRTEHLFHHGGWGETDDTEAKWQKHVIVAMWVALGIFIAVATGLFYGEGHGFFKSSHDYPAAVAPWPDTMP